MCHLKWANRWKQAGKTVRTMPRLKKTLRSVGSLVKGQLHPQPCGHRVEAAGMCMRSRLEPLAQGASALCPPVPLLGHWPVTSPLETPKSRHIA